MFKRRERRTVLRTVVEAFWPKGGWGRAFSYVRHRLRRLPDPPHKISRGIAAGVISTFSPFFGFHFLTAFIFGWILRGNILAAMLTTFVGNPLTFPFIVTMNLRLGSWILGDAPAHSKHYGVIDAFIGAIGDLWHNFLAAFTSARADWQNLAVFYHEVFLPYLVGGLINGVLLSIVAYYTMLPILVAYQNRRKGRFKERLEKLRRKRAVRADEPGDPL